MAMLPMEDVANCKNKVRISLMKFCQDGIRQNTPITRMEMPKRAAVPTAEMREKVSLNLKSPTAATEKTKTADRISRLDKISSNILSISDAPWSVRELARRRIGSRRPRPPGSGRRRMPQLTGHQ